MRKAYIMSAITKISHLRGLDLDSLLDRVGGTLKSLCVFGANLFAVCCRTLSLSGRIQKTGGISVQTDDYRHGSLTSLLYRVYGADAWGAFHQAFCQCFSLTNFISY